MISQGICIQCRKERQLYNGVCSECSMLNQALKDRIYVFKAF
jgi:hypothetical protein